jgi:SNF2 family DNA or RNA helicase
MSIQVRIDGDRATAHGPLPFNFLKIVSDLSGSKKWNGSKSVTFDANMGNIRKLKESGVDLKFDDVTGTLRNAERLETLPTQMDKVKRAKTNYQPKHAPWPFQQKCLDISWDRENYALLFEMSLGKTFLLITNIGMLYYAKGLRGALIVAPAGVDEQWVREQIPMHFDPRIKYQATLWNGKGLDTSKLDKKKFQFFCCNTDMLRTDKGYLACLAFINWCDGDVLMAIDESHDFKNMRAQRTKAAIELGQMCAYRRISTGTPIGKNVLDAFAQFYFLDPKILGHKYITSFRNRYCIMGGFQFRQVIGNKASGGVLPADCSSLVSSDEG